MGAKLDHILHKEDPSSATGFGDKQMHSPKGLLSTITLYFEARRDRIKGAFDEAQIKYSAVSSSRLARAKVLGPLRGHLSNMSFKMLKQNREKQGINEERKAKAILHSVENYEELQIEAKREAIELLLASAKSYLDAENVASAAWAFRNALSLTVGEDQLKDLHDRIIDESTRFSLLQAQGLLR